MPPPIALAEEEEILTVPQFLEMLRTGEALPVEARNKPLVLQFFKTLADNMRGNSNSFQFVDSAVRLFIHIRPTLPVESAEPLFTDICALLPQVAEATGDMQFAQSVRAIANGVQNS